MDRDNRKGSWSRPLFNLSSRAWQQLRAKYPERIDWRLQTRIRIASALVSAMGGMQELLHGERVAAVAITSPIFVVGHWRSGTTLLHEMIALDDRLLTPTTYQCFNPHSFLLSSDGSTRPKAHVVRPSGDRIVSSESPQEEEFAMLCLGCVSPYEGFVFPSALGRLSSLCNLDDFDMEQRTEWEKRFVSFLKAVSLGGDGKSLLLKSPSNSFRIAALLRLFPDARFIWIVREPTAVIVSALDMWEKMWERYALGAPLKATTMQRLVIDSYLDLEQKVGVDTQSLASSKLVIIKFEDLVARPDETIDLIYSKLQLGGWSHLRTAINQFLEASPPLRAPHRATPALIDEVRERCASIFDKYGYQRS